MSEFVKLEVGIVGAGIAGLCTAIALRRAGHDVEIFEKSKFSNEVGAAITIGANGMRVLDRWGFDSVKAGGIENTQIRMPRGDTLQLDYQASFRDIEARYGHQWLFFHRQDLHSTLREMALDPTLVSGSSAKINLGTPVTDIDCETGIMKANGMEVQKDLLIIANGSHCQFHEEINGAPNPIKSTGRSVYRCMVPFSEIMADPITRPLFEHQPTGLFGPNMPSKGIICANYPCRNGQILNCALLHPTKEKEKDAQDWDSPASLEDVLQCMDGFHPALQALYKKAEQIKVYNLMFRAPVKRLTLGKAILIGDAAHPMLTNQAQGATISIESTGALEILFSNLTSHSEIASRVALFDTFRLPRCATTQIMSNSPPGPPGYKMLVEGVRNFYDGPLPPMTAKPFSEPFQQFFMGYDVFREAEKVVRGESWEKVSGYRG